MKIRKKVPVSAEEKQKQRHSWPLDEMSVGDCLEIKDKTKWPQASKYAHVVGKRKGWKFTTVWLEEKNLGRVRRTA